MAIRQSMLEAGYEYIKALGFHQHLLRDKATGNAEVWFCNKFTASYAITWRNTALEFERSFAEYCEAYIE